MRASLGTALGVASGTIIGGYTAAGIFRTSSTNNPDAGLGNVGIVFFGIYSGATIGAATGTTIALNTKEKDLKGFYHCFITLCYTYTYHIAGCINST